MKSSCNHEITSFDELNARVEKGQRIICLYSGGLDGTYLLFKLREHAFKNVVALTIDLGQEINLEAIRSVATQLDVSWENIDCRDDFLHEYVLPSIYCQAKYLEGHPISASLSRPLMASAAKKFATERGGQCVLHTSSVSQNSLRRFNNSFKLLDTKIFYGSPFALAGISRKQKIQQLRKVGIPWPSEQHFSVDDNFWVHEFEYGDCDNPENICFPLNVLKWKEAKNRTLSEVSIEFDNGVPISINGQVSNQLEIIGQLNIFVGAFGHGRYIWLEEIDDGKKVQEMHEAPAAHILFDAYRRLESATLSSEDIREKMHIEQLWVREASEGRWFANLRPACQLFCSSLASHVSGEVAYIVEKQRIVPRRIIANRPRYIKDRNQYESTVAF